MNRFVCQLSLLVIGMFVLFSGIELGLAKVATSPRQSQLAVYSTNGERIQIEIDSVDRLVTLNQADISTLPRFLRRGKSRAIAVSEDQGRFL